MKDIRISKSITRCEPAGTTSATIQIGDIDIDVTAYDIDTASTKQQAEKVQRVLDLFVAIKTLVR